jgi:hypothetical protein
MLTELAIQHDDFTDKKTLEFIRVGNENTSVFKLYSPQAGTVYDYLGFTFVNHDGYVYISFESRQDGFPLHRGDTITMLFDGNKKIEYLFTKNSTGSKYSRTNYCALTPDHLQIFADSDFLKLKIVNSRNNTYWVLNLDHRFKDSKLSYQKAQYEDEVSGKLIIRDMANKFIKAHLIPSDLGNIFRLD